MNKTMLEEFVREAGRSIKIESDVDDFRKMLTKVTLEIALNHKLNPHLGYEKHAISAFDNARVEVHMCDFRFLSYHADMAMY